MPKPFAGSRSAGWPRTWPKPLRGSVDDVLGDHSEIRLACPGAIELVPANHLILLQFENRLPHLLRMGREAVEVLQLSDQRAIGIGRIGEGSPGTIWVRSQRRHETRFDPFGDPVDPLTRRRGGNSGQVKEPPGQLLASPGGVGTSGWRSTPPGVCRAPTTRET